MLRAIIIDDEPKSREGLEAMLQDMIKDVVVAATADSVANGVRAIEKHQPDVVFLDIEMPRNDGFALFEAFNPVDFEVVFTTAHEQYALQAFRTTAIDYLLKPIDLDQLNQAVDKVREKRQKDRVNKNFEVFVNNLKNSNANHQIAISSSDGLIFLKVENIIYLRGDGAYTYFFLKSGERITTSKNLKEYEDLLSDYDFFRVHKSFLINLHEMKKYVRGEGGYVVMSNGDTVDVSKRRKENFMAALSKL
ncbi:MAG: response regulator transcription factor [Flavobacteriales bacterium]|nr:response regulator transcription factor [Bacteroidota bacterium]MCB9240767.1 response regulator transcription factor [Flavobacteriales bacterium]